MATFILPQTAQLNPFHPPTVTLSMYWGQVMSADGSCQHAVNEAIAHRMLNGMKISSANTCGAALLGYDYRKRWYKRRHDTLASAS